MKNLFYCLAAFLLFVLPGAGCAQDVPIDEAHFPDPVFREYLRSGVYDNDKDGVLSQEECDRINFLNMNFWYIANLEGIGYFRNLQSLECVHTDLTHLDLSKNTNLVSLYCSNTYLQSLDLSKNAKLEILHCGDNPGLTELVLGELPGLTELECQNTPLSSLDISQCLNLQTLNCNNTQLEFLDLSRNTALVNLYCSDTRLTSIDLTGLQNLSVTQTHIFNNECRISVGQDRTFDMGTLPGFDASRVVNCEGGSIQGNILTMDRHYVDYVYKTGYGGEGSGGDDQGPWYSPQYVVFRLIDLSVAFPDTSFQKFVLESFDKNSDGVLDAQECEVVVNIDISGTAENPSPIKSLDGIDLFPDLGILRCAYTSLDSLNLDGNPGISLLDCKGTPLQKINLTGNKYLKWLNCSFTDLRQLDLDSNSMLHTLYCNDSKLESLDVSGAEALTGLFCSNNYIQDLVLDSNQELNYLDCSNNLIQSLDVSKNPELQYLYCYRTGISSLDVSRNPGLLELWCSHTGISTLDLGKNILLRRLYCDNTDVSSLVMEANVNLEELWCSNTPIKGLDLTKLTSLKSLWIENTSISTLDLTANRQLTDLVCGKNEVETLDLTYQEMLEYLVCDSMPLTSLDLTSNDQLELLEAENLGKKVKGKDDKPEYDLSQLEGFDVERVLYVKGGQLKGHLLKFSDSVLYYGYSVLAGETDPWISDTLEFWLGMDTSETPDPEPEDTLGIKLPTGLVVEVDGREVGMSWTSQEDYVYQVKVEDNKTGDLLRKEVESAGSRTHCSFTDMVPGSYNWAVRVVRVESQDTLSKFVYGDDFEVEEGTSLDLDLISNFHIYPNPTSGSFFVEVSEPVLLEIFNSAGLCIHREEVEPGRESLNMGYSGLYLIRLTTPDGRMVMKRLVVR